MHQVHFNKDYTTLLSQREMTEPYLVLQEIFDGCISPDPIRETFLEIVCTSLSRERWRKFPSPLVLMESYRKLLRLLEAGWLVQFLDPVHSLLDYRICQVRKGLYDFFFTGLDPSISDYPFDLEKYDMSLFKQIDLILVSLHRTYLRSANPRISKISKQTIHEISLKSKRRKTLFVYYSKVHHVFDNSTKQDLLAGVDRIRHILSVEGYWKIHPHPADLVYRFHDYLFILESVWKKWNKVRKQCNGDGAKMLIPLSNTYSGDLEGSRNVLSEWHMIDESFRARTIAEWRDDLDTCMLQVLGNVAIEGDRMDLSDGILGLIELMIELISSASYAKH